MELQNRAKYLARVINVLYAEKHIRGKLVAASRGARFLSLGIRLTNPLTLDAALGLAENLALATNTEAVIAQRRSDAPGLCTYQFQLQSGYWQSYTRADLEPRKNAVGVGLGESRRQIDFTFDLEPHALIAGETRIAGKTETVRTILAGLFGMYQPGQLQAVICDAHRDYESFASVAHLAYPLAHSTDDIDAAIAFAGQELQRRKEHNMRLATPMLVVIDEAETELYEKDYPQRFALAHKIGKEAAKFRMYLIISTQKPKSANLGDLISNLGNRFVGKVTDADTSWRLSGRKGLHCELLTGHGDFLHISGATVERLQVALATEKDIAQLPRAEIARPEVVEEDTPAVLNMPDEPKVGRPSNELDPRKIAYYMAQGPQKVSIATARDTLELARYNHYAHRDFAQEIIDELRRLMTAMKGATV